MQARTEKVIALLFLLLLPIFAHAADTCSTSYPVQCADWPKDTLLPRAADYVGPNVTITSNMPCGREEDWGCYLMGTIFLSSVLYERDDYEHHILADCVFKHEKKHADDPKWVHAVAVKVSGFPTVIDCGDGTKWIEPIKLRSDNRWF